MAILLYLQDYLSYMRCIDSQDLFFIFNEMYAVSESFFLVRILLRGGGRKEFYTNCNISWEKKFPINHNHNLLEKKTAILILQGRCTSNLLNFHMNFTDIWKYSKSNHCHDKFHFAYWSFTIILSSFFLSSIWTYSRFP